MIAPVMVMAVLLVLLGVAAVGWRLASGWKARATRRKARAEREAASLRRRHGERAAEVIERSIAQARSGRRQRHLKRVQKMLAEPPAPAEPADRTPPET